MRFNFNCLRFCNSEIILSIFRVSNTALKFEQRFNERWIQLRSAIPALMRLLAQYQPKRQHDAPLEHTESTKLKNERIVGFKFTLPPVIW